jgi:hypothetical protein
MNMRKLYCGGLLLPALIACLAFISLQRQAFADSSSGDLLSYVKTDTDVIGTGCTRDGDFWVLAHDTKLVIPVSPQGNYTLSLRAMRKSGGNDVKIYFPVGDAIVQFVLSGWNGSASGLQMIDHKGWDQNKTSVKPGTITNGKWYDIAITVADNGADADISVKLDGESYIQWSGAKSELSSTAGISERVKADKLIMLGCAHDAVDEFSSVRLNKPGIIRGTHTAPDIALAPQPTFDDTPTNGPTTRPARQQSSIRALYVIEIDSGLMLGKANDFILTITSDQKPHKIGVVFPQQVGDQMHLVVDDVLRFLRLSYPNWNVSHAELTFADKYNPHDGGSIGAAVGTLILSTIRGFEIDPKTAITGDVSADGKVRMIGGVAAKLRGAAAAGCDVVAVPADNEAQVADGMIYLGPSLVTDVQVLTIANLDDAEAVTRLDRSESLTKAIALFSTVQAQLKGSITALTTTQVQAELRHVLELAPQHLSAKLLLSLATNSQSKTLSATASMYYAFVAARPMLEVMVISDPEKHHDHIPLGLSKSLEELSKLRPICDPKTRPLILAWSQFIRTWNSPHPAPKAIVDDRNRVVEEMQKLSADQDLMQKMISEGI